VKTKSNGAPAPTGTVRCAVYCRKSTEEGLDREFNSLDAQREAGEAYIGSQRHEGWTCLPERYDDGGFTGGNLERPALKRLLADVEAGKIDCIVVYKVDRLSRSLLDFARLIATFDEHQVAFVSVTQQFNTASSMGRLVLNVLLSFAQFEREIISERTRDKIAATRRKGKWSGGVPLLGYDLDPSGPRLLVNEDEAVRVRAIVALYLEHKGLVPVVQELGRRGWVNKRWVTRSGRERGGKAFTKTSLHKLLTNPAYTGRVRYKGEIHPGEHAAIIDTATWQKVQSLLAHNGRTGGAMVRNRFGALLKGLLRCVPCGCAMTPTHTMRKGGRRYYYYVCMQAQKRGWQSCPSKSVPAGEIERLVLEHVRRVGQDPTLIRDVLAEAQRQAQERKDQLQAERRSLENELARWDAEVRQLVDQVRPGDARGAALTRLAELQQRITGAESRMREVCGEQETLGQGLDKERAAQALTKFDPVWETLAPREQVRVVQLLVERVDYDGPAGKVAIRFHAAGIQNLAEELAGGKKGESA
jgi:site-specific DNA recombinase